MSNKDSGGFLNGVFRFFVPQRSPHDIAVEKHSRNVSRLRDEVNNIQRTAEKISRNAGLGVQLLALQKRERTLVEGSAEMYDVRIQMSVIRFRMKHF